MTGCCCAPSGYDELFGEKQARKDARRYRRKGLDKAARWIVDAVREQGVEGATVLEPGGGVGAIQLELLKAGAARSTVVELSPSYEEEAAALTKEAGLEERIERRLGDFAADGVEPADVVVMHRVVCCYPDYERLLGAAAGHARHVLVFTHPPRNAVSRAFFSGGNLWMRLRGKEFRAFAHPPEALIATARAHGFESFASRRGGIWRGAAFARAVDEPALR
jgi:2-polyprenyl-3-methyl-5-hydroxy-6-metoxy-1,4-benzoquinol methylase